jgi:beta-mannosidase
LFEVNGVRIFMGGACVSRRRRFSPDAALPGSNWIPADNFLTTISDARYKAWLELARDGGQNMVRVWGGGIYEPDIFYDLCDGAFHFYLVLSFLAPVPDPERALTRRTELGLLVWTDFAFACGVYPAHAPFVAAVRAEAADVLRRVRRHPCLGLFCGNNEDYQQVLQWGDVPDLPARIIYEDVLPTLVDALTRTAPSSGYAGAAEQRDADEDTGAVSYHRGSPYGGKGWDTADPTVGDVHQWDIWAGAMRPWQEYDVRGGRFVRLVPPHSSRFSDRC